MGRDCQHLIAQLRQFVKHLNIFQSHLYSEFNSVPNSECNSLEKSLTNCFRLVFRAGMLFCMSEGKVEDSCQYELQKFSSILPWLKLASLQTSSFCSPILRGPTLKSGFYLPTIPSSLKTFALPADFFSICTFMLLHTHTLS